MSSDRDPPSRPAGVSLSQATPADAEEIAAVFRDARAAMTYLPESPYSHAQTVEFFHGVLADPGNLVLVARPTDGAIAGFGVFGEGHLDHLYVRRDRQRQGIGTRLIETAQARFGRLDGWVFQRNAEAIALYERSGFEVVERTDGSRNEEHEPDVRVVWRRG